MLELKELNTNLSDYLNEIGSVFKIFNLQDSGCISYGVDINGIKYFVKYSNQQRGIESLKRAINICSKIHHQAFPKLLNYFNTSDGLALVYKWVAGEVLNSPEFTGEEGRNKPSSTFYRFKNLPSDDILNALNIIYDVHLQIAEKGFIAVDFYDGCIIYDFENKLINLCDFDEYHSGTFILQEKRLPGSSRFMAPEEFIRGELIEQSTNVFTLGRTALVFLSNGTTDKSFWKGPEKLLPIIEKAVSKERKNRYQTIKEFVTDWISNL